MMGHKNLRERNRVAALLKSSHSSPMDFQTVDELLLNDCAFLMNTTFLRLIPAAFCPSGQPKLHFWCARGIAMTTASVQPALAPDGPPDPDLVRIRDLVYQVAGIFHPDTKLRLLFDRCGRRMKELKTQSLREYFECLTVRPMRQAELVALLNEITIGETCFFRNQPQLDALRQIVLPKIHRSESQTSHPPLAHMERRLLHGRRALHAEHDAAGRRRSGA